MDTSDPRIQFDAAGVCNHCRDYDLNVAMLVASGGAGSENLGALVSGIKAAGAGKKYDALLGVSGGVDSSYLALLLRDWGVRTLLFHMDNGWDSHQALRNVANVVDATGFDYESVVLDWEEFRDLQLAFLSSSVVEAETPTDVAIVSAAYGVAARHDIKVMISASNLASEGILPRLWHYDATDTRYLKGIHARFGTGKLRRYPVLTVPRQISHRMLRKVRTVYPLNYIDYDKVAALNRLRGELAWQEYGGKHHESLYTKFVQAVLLPAKFGIDYRKATYSSMICSHRISRDEALSRLQEPLIDEHEAQELLSYVAVKLRVSPGRLKEILEDRPLFYYNYPNNERLLNLLYSSYRRLFGRRAT
jgi:N-acetyl sugar amidotransferase